MILGSQPEGERDVAPAPSGLRSCAEEELDEEAPVRDEPSMALVAVEGNRGRPGPRDGRELVPAGPDAVEEILERVLEENRLLKMRLEQMEVGQGWYGPNPMLADVAQQSPVSFAPEEVRGQGVQRGRSRTAEGEGLLGSSGGSLRAATGLGSTSGILDAGRQVLPEPCGDPVIFGPSADQHGRTVELRRGGLAYPSAAQHFFLGSSIGPERGLPPVPRLSLEGLVEDGFKRTLGAPGVVNEGGLQAGLTLEARKELEGLILDVVRKGKGGFEAGGTGQPLPRDSGGSSVPSQDLRFQTPRSSVPERMGMGFDAQGYPVSPGGTVIKPPPLPPQERAEFLPGPARAPVPSGSNGLGERPEEPAKYIFEIPKLGPPDLSNSAVTCGNWLAQVRQVLVGLSPTAAVWWSGGLRRTLWIGLCWILRLS